MMQYYTFEDRIIRDKTFNNVTNDDWDDFVTALVEGAIDCAFRDDAAKYAALIRMARAERAILSAVRKLNIIKPEDLE
jgi:hypothetical protein